LGQAYENGTGVPRETDRARRYFRLCAARGESACQLRLGRLLLQKTDRSEDDYVQGLAWLELAAEKNVSGARAILDTEQPGLSPAQVALIHTWKEQLAPK